jgi:hypothetical protein
MDMDAKSLLTNNDEFDRLIVEHTLTGAEESPIAAFLHAVAEANPQDPQSALTQALKLLEIAFDAGRVVGQLDIYVEVVQDHEFKGEARPRLTN